MSVDQKSVEPKSRYSSRLRYALWICAGVLSAMGYFLNSSSLFTCGFLLVLMLSAVDSIRYFRRDAIES